MRAVPVVPVVHRDYDGHMIKSLRESKAKLSELVERASHGEDVLITVRGKVKAKLTRAGTAGEAPARAKWIGELRALQKLQGKRKPRMTVEQVLDEIREDRI